MYDHLDEFLATIEPETEPKFETDELENPDKPKYDLEWGHDHLQALLCLLATDDNALTKCSKALEPAIFPERNHQTIARCIKKYYERYGQAPQQRPLRHAVEQAISTMDTGRRALFLAELDIVLDYDGRLNLLAEREYMIHQFLGVAKNLQTKRAMSQMIDVNNSGGSYKDLVDCLQRVKDIEDAHDTPSELSGWLNVLADDFTAGEKATWIIGDVIAQGQAVLLAAPSKGGKSIFMAWLIGKLLAGEDILGGAVNVRELPILYLDFENPRSYFAYWYRRFLRNRDPMPTAKYMKYKTNTEHPTGNGTLPDYLTPNWLSVATADDHPGIVVIDTFRGAFQLTPRLEANFENSPDVIGRLLRPFVKWAHKTGWAVVILHHTNKTGGISGCGEFSAAVDSVIEMRRDVDACSNISELVFKGRYEKPIPPKMLEFDGDDFLYRGMSEAKSDRDRDAILSLFVGSQKLQTGRIYELAQGIGINRNKAAAALKALMAAGELRGYRDGMFVFYAKPTLGAV